VAWIYLPAHATYLGIPAYPFTMPLLVWSLLAGPVIGVLAAGYIRLIGWVSFYRFTGWRSIPAMVVAFGILGVIGFWWPQLFGNGRGMANDAFLGIGGFGLMLVLFLLKPLVTALCLSSGATGGLFTPTLSTGATFGGAFGIAWSLLWPGSPSGAYAMVGAAAMLGAAMQAPLASLALVLELTHSGFEMMVPMLAATVTATIVSRYIDGYSIYSARLPPQRGGPARRARPFGRPEPHADTEGLDTA
jgi:H+/Cl- antiporter ClcA